MQFGCIRLTSRTLRFKMTITRSMTKRNRCQSLKKEKSRVFKSSVNRSKVSSRDKHRNRLDSVKSTQKSKTCLLDLSNEGLVSAILLRRPSSRNRSPYVADARLTESGREVIVHVPSLDMGGKCVPGAKIIVKPARDRKGKLVGANAVSAKYGTPKCEFIAQLLWVQEPENDPGCFVGAHPSLGERIAEELIRTSSLQNIQNTQTYKREVQKPCGCNMRADFVITHPQIHGKQTLPKNTVVEVKTIVDTDYKAETAPNKKCVFVGPEPYSRAAIFPWGQSKQKGPDGEKVVSARAIKHVMELTSIAKGKAKDSDGSLMSAAVVFIVVRNDAETFRPNHEACPSFARYLKIAKASGVTVLARRIRWGKGIDVGKAFDDGALEVCFP